MVLVGRNLLTIREAAEQLGVGTQAILMAIHRKNAGKPGLHASKYGRDWLIEPKDLAAYAERPTRESRDPRRRKATPDIDETS
jgi:excisionase family DNA binding protein